METEAMRKEWLETDYYAVLGVSKDASNKEIKKSFRKLAQQYHPDTNPGDSAAEIKFKEINEAYDVLGDEETRKEYDHVREMGYFVGGPGGGQQYVRVEDLLGGQNFGGNAAGSPFDLIGDLFGSTQRVRTRPQQGRDLTTEVNLSFHEAISGTTKTINVNGAPVKVKTPIGIENGKRIRVKGKGEPGANGGQPGDLLVKVNVAEHPIFGRKGRHLSIEAPISFVEAALGAEIDVPTLDGKVRLRVPAGTPSGKTFRVAGKGVETKKGTGDLLIVVNVEVPTELTDAERNLLEKFRDNRTDDNPRSHLGV